MKILAFDGTAKAASVAVADGDKILSCCTVDNGLTQSELLLPMAEDMLKSLKLKFSDIDLFATSVGPGSFTGVRIGVSLIKGLAFGRNIPCVGVSTIEALAENLRGLRGIIVPCMDARRGQVYSATFICDGKKLTRVTEDRAIALSDLARELEEYKEQAIYLCGDGYSVAKKALTNYEIDLCETPELLILENAASVALVAKRKYENNEAVSDSELSPTYLRMPQAERERLEREAIKRKDNG
ncbi:MAG: tRNA (adenosine(37)-N6)-threonylcarbamoyltransferase complex dimerization subunit type 1 TsaB [Clostridia bacterium]|nr:tRNA (adenosine(37)-N6)-threonylcarbamoyltransferase complex dimerization subunit type 1 TsaB [Clostridia bacterium]